MKRFFFGLFLCCPFCFGPFATPRSPRSPLPCNVVCDPAHNYNSSVFLYHQLHSGRSSAWISARFETSNLQTIRH
uniref:Putative secreted peptide n=1 Tax=Anopheles braziliensis TaxID=58242 RepID=A0A2M3ZRE0_9DIPT